MLYIKILKLIKSIKKFINTQVGPLNNFLYDLKIKIYNPKPEIANLLIIDNFEPSKLHTGFRVEEFNYLLKDIPNSKLLSMSPIIYGQSDLKKRVKTGEIKWIINQANINIWNSNKNLYSNIFKIKSEQFIYMTNRPYKVNGAYMMFLYNAYLSLKFVEKNKIPFVFTMFPGGGFWLNNDFNDKMMKDVFASPMFKGCYVTQKIIYDYVLSKNFTTPDKLFFRYGGGFFQFTKDDVLPKMDYKVNKETFDICFVAYKYMKQGLNKGFDLAVHSLKALVKKYPFIHLHCVGTNTLSDFNEDFSDIKNNIHFYGSQKPNFFIEFYKNMDIALSPNRPNLYGKGSFDGFPLLVEAGFFGVPIFCTDELNLNNDYINEEDLVIIKPELDDICKTIEYYIDNLEKLRHIGVKGKEKIQQIFDINKQKADRMEFINKYLNIE